MTPEEGRYFDHIERLDVKAQRLVENHPTEPQLVEPLVKQGVGALERTLVDDAYLYLTASLGLMYRWVEEVIRPSEGSGMVARLRPGVNFEKARIERALANRYACYPIALTGQAFADLMIADSYGFERGERHDDISKRIHDLPSDQRDRALSWIALTARR
jgi:hypothetical protein